MWKNPACQLSKYCVQKPIMIMDLLYSFYHFPGLSQQFSLRSAQLSKHEVTFYTHCDREKILTRLESSLAVVQDSGCQTQVYYHVPLSKEPQALKLMVEKFTLKCTLMCWRNAEYFLTRQLRYSKKSL